MEEFKTPTHTKFKNVLRDGKTIPESPLMTRLGYGTGVSVYRLKRSPKVGKCQSPWAVKRVIRNMDSKCYAERLKDEAEILQRLNHPNIVGFRAFVKAEDGRDCLAMEECDTSIGDLIEQRCEEGLGPIPAHNIMKVALDIANALDYLHNKCSLLHGDIKTFNVLVKGDFEVMKLCDFGVSVSLNEDGTMKDSPENFVGTDCWAAPETLAEDGVITSKADIFPFGLVLWEMMTLKVPHFDDSLPEERMNTSIVDQLNNSDESALSETSHCVNPKYGTRPPLPDNPLGDEYKPVIELFNMCTEEDFNKRPSAKEIIEFLESCN